MTDIIYIPHWNQSVIESLIPKPTTVYYAIQTGWWTVSRLHLYKGRHDIPVDPRGSTLIEVPFWNWWLPESISKIYPGGMGTLMAGHHGNLWALLPDYSLRPTSVDDSESFTRWEKHETLVAEWEARSKHDKVRLLEHSWSIARSTWPFWPDLPREVS